MTYLQYLKLSEEIPKGRKPVRVNAPAKPGPKSYPATVPGLKPRVGYGEIRAIWEGKAIDALMKKDGW
jgi:hypothetical protein